jgi:hypothetical protein
MMKTKADMPKIQKMLKTIHNRREGRGNTRQKGCERNAWLDKVDHGCSQGDVATQLE